MGETPVKQRRWAWIGFDPLHVEGVERWHVSMGVQAGVVELIDVEGVHPLELEIFYEALHEVFPEVKIMGEDEQL